MTRRPGRCWVRVVTATLPDPGRGGSLDEIADGLRRLKVWAGDPSYDAIKNRINEAWRATGRPAGELARKATVADCFKAGRRRLNTDLVIAVVQALHPDVGYVTQWRQALRVIGGEARASAQVRVQDTLDNAASAEQIRRCSPTPPAAPCWSPAGAASPACARRSS